MPPIVDIEWRLGDETRIRLMPPHLGPMEWRRRTAAVPDDHEGHAMATLGRYETLAAPTTTGGWASLLVEEERHAATQGFGAGVIVVAYAAELLRYGDEDGRSVAEAAISGIIERRLGWTDRTAMIAAGRIGVVMMPVSDASALRGRAHELHRDLRACGLDLDVSYSLRRRTGGLRAAAARADAVLDNSVRRSLV